MTNKVSANRPTCRFCKGRNLHTFIDLGMSPLCESYIPEEKLNQMEAFYPLHVYVCADCFLVQLLEYVSPKEIYSEYAYFSSFSDSWLQHAKTYTETMVKRFGYNAKSTVMEIASNDGYLLQYFIQQGVPVLGIEPARNIAKVAIEKGIPTVNEFFGKVTAQKIASERGKADLLLGNNVLAHVPEINDFVGGMKILLKEDGVITMEFPHLERLIDENQFDTIYHEHFSYLSFSFVNKLFDAHGLAIFDVQELPTHGGSLRIFACHTENVDQFMTPNVAALLEREEAGGFSHIDYYSSFGEKVKETKRALLEMLIDIKRQGKRIVSYAAAGKTNTLLNYCAIRTDFIDFAADRNPYKQGKYLPGTHIPIFAPDKIREVKPDYLFIGAWNIKEEIIAQTAYIKEWGGKWIVPIPTARVVG